MIPPPAPVPLRQGRDSTAMMITANQFQVRMTSMAVVTAASIGVIASRRAAQGVG